MTTQKPSAADIRARIEARRRRYVEQERGDRWALDAALIELRSQRAAQDILALEDELAALTFAS